jgi:hypothetical protein
VKVEHEGVEGDGVLITTGEGGHFASFKCSSFVSIEVAGNGFIGTITSPATNESGTKATLSF